MDLNLNSSDIQKNKELKELAPEVESVGDNEWFRDWVQSVERQAPKVHFPSSSKSSSSFRDIIRQSGVPHDPTRQLQESRYLVYNGHEFSIEPSLGIEAAEENQRHREMVSSVDSTRGPQSGPISALGLSKADLLEYEKDLEIELQETEREIQLLRQKKALRMTLKNVRAELAGFRN